MDGPGPDRRLCRRARPPAHLHLGDHQSPRYEKKHTPGRAPVPNIHPLVDKLYKPYDIGQIGQLDLHILAEIFGGDSRRDLTPAWDGGIYWAGQRLGAKTPAEQASTKSLALFYLSAWKNSASARPLPTLCRQLGRKYSGLKPDLRRESSAHLPAAPRRINGADLHHQRRSGGHHYPRQAGLRRRKLRPDSPANSPR